MRRLRLTAAAQRDFDEISAHLEFWTGDEAQADRVLGQIMEQCSHLAQLPGILGRPRPEIAQEVRSFPFQRYTIFFRYAEGEFVVVNVLNSRRDINAHLDMDEED